jgi:septum formation protein
VRDVAVALAEFKARKVSASHPDALVIGADQVLVFCGRIVNKSPDLAEARSLLASLSGKSHELISAAALAKDGSVVWRTASTVEMQMRTVSDAFIDNYLAACGEGILSSVGAYKFEAEGVQLFSGYSGDYFAILGLPLLPLLSALREFGVLPA